MRAITWFLILLASLAFWTVFLRCADYAASNFYQERIYAVSTAAKN